MKVLISDIKRFAVHDGNGIRTTVFFMGCPLKCLWCHNPECISAIPKLAYHENKCIGCGECEVVCKYGAHKIINGIHIFDRELCTGCGDCEAVCLGNALCNYGKYYTVDELMCVIIKDKEFFKASNGGVTLSGGECLMYPDFCTELLKKLKNEGINTAVDTCGYVKKSSIDAVMDYTDTFLYDIKGIDENVHLNCTGVSNKIILENFKYINSKGKNIEIRIPYVPGYNSNQIEKIAFFLRGMNNIVGVKLLPYHSFASSKYTSLGMQNTLPINVPSAKEIERARNILKEYNLSVL